MKNNEKESNEKESNEKESKYVRKNKNNILQNLKKILCNS